MPTCATSLRWDVLPLLIRASLCAPANPRGCPRGPCSLALQQIKCLALQPGPGFSVPCTLLSSSSCRYWTGPQMRDWQLPCRRALTVVTCFALRHLSLCATMARGSPGGFKAFVWKQTAAASTAALTLSSMIPQDSPAGSGRRECLLPSLPARCTAAHTFPGQWPGSAPTGHDVYWMLTSANALITPGLGRGSQTCQRNGHQPCSPESH